MLILFDIDGTLIDSGGAGMTSISETALLLYGGEGPALDLAGSTDKGVVMGIWDHFGLEHEPAEFGRFYETYLGRLAENLASGRFSDVGVLPGSHDLIAKLLAEGHSLGLLTGNIAAGAKAKTEHYGLGGHFSFGSYGDDHHDRNELGPIALRRALEVTGKAFSAEETLVIGDTPKDIACARAFGAKVVAVATGRFSAGELAAPDPDHVLESLEDWEDGFLE